jgi:UDP:flavonoid glycosyltransferase YjiC (YdhE family)
VGKSQNRPSGTLPDDVGVFEYAPFGQVMPRTLAVVHQGGIGTTAQVLRAGRPAVIMPFGHDTLDNARRVGELGVGVTVHRRRFRPGVLTDALREVTREGYRERARALGERIRAEDGVGTALNLIESSI